MIASKNEAAGIMRKDIYSAIRRNLSHQGKHLSRHEVVEVLASVISGQIEVIKDNARKQHISWFD